MNDGKRLFGSIILGAALFFFFPVVIGGLSKISALRAAVAERQDLLDKRTAIFANVATAYQTYQQNVKGDDAQKFSALVPVNKSEAEIFSALQSIASSNGVQLNKVNMAEQPAANKGGYKVISLSLEIIGSYAGLKQFLTSVEGYVRLLNVNSISMTVDAKNSQVIHFLVQAETYYLK